MDSVRRPWMRSAQKVKYCAVISSKRWRLTVLLKGRLWAAIMKMDAAGLLPRPSNSPELRLVGRERAAAEGSPEQSHCPRRGLAWRFSTVDHGYSQ